MPVAIVLLLSFSSPGLGQDIMDPSQYIVLIQQRIYPNIVYPTEAKQKGWKGIVRVRFNLMPDGRIKEPSIIKSSGYLLLDQAVISAIKKTSSGLPFENYSGTKKIKVVLPISYQAPEESVLPKRSDKASSPAKAKTPEPKPYSSAARSDQRRVADYSAIKETKDEAILAEEMTLSKELQRLIAVKKTKVTTGLVRNDGREPKELQHLIELAIKNNEPTRIAQEEVELAQLGIKEAQRNLFPALKLAGYTTDGEVYNLSYTERELNLQLDQPLYYGGRLLNSLKQANVNLEITKANYDRLKIDVAHKTEVAYYNLIGSRMNFNIQKEILREAESILEIVKKQAAADLVTPLEIASAQSRYEQITFQLHSTAQDVAMAELTFMQVLDTSKPPQITTQQLEVEEIAFSLDSCLETGLDSRPEIHLSELLVKFHQYGKKVEESKNNFTVDLTASYGSYQGAWETEEMRNSSNWYAGVKATKPWGANTVNASAAIEETQPRFGQTSPTKSSTLSAEINLMDNLKRLSDKKKAEIDLNRAVNDLNETVKTINFEIKDAYLNCQKALLQVTTAELETKFRSRQLKVLRTRAQVGEIEFSNIMEILINLSQAQTNYTQALANYFISLANLKKAVGIIDFGFITRDKS